MLAGYSQTRQQTTSSSTVELLSTHQKESTLMTQSISPVVQRAQLLAYQLNISLSNYQKELANVKTQLERSVDEVTSAAQSSWEDTTTARAGNVVTVVANVAQRMRLDLIVKYAGEVERIRAELDALLKYMLTDDEKAQIGAILAQGE